MWERQVSDLQHIYNKLLFDSINEALSKILGAAAEQPPVWLAYGRQPPPLTRPPTGPALVQRVQQLVRKWSEKQCGDDQKVPPTHTLSTPSHVGKREREPRSCGSACDISKDHASAQVYGRRKSAGSRRSVCSEL